MPVQSGRQSNQSSSNEPHTLPSRWQLTWSDEFDGANGSLPDASKWTQVTGGGGWGNRELEYYTARAENAHQEFGNLVITAARETYAGPDGVTRDFTSARLKTAGKFSQTYGRFEARIKLPAGRGLWPAFWLLGEDIAQAGWPACGEIDIMELVGSAPDTILGTIHGPGYSGSAGVSSKYTLSGRKSFSDEFHIFAVDWAPNIVRFYADDVLYATRTPTDLPPGSRWVFDKPFFIIINVAVGGNLPGPPDDTTVFPQTMRVDYVRVFKRVS
ncbi:MAG TPA: glycoside hydrolase family 16 protein [Candidatus Sulfotelmatobacter sp.]|nr:glycoside hydrolase family 16 protein [Candidatus Sulfotelmatobacter sp.]